MQPEKSDPKAIARYCVDSVAVIGNATDTVIESVDTPFAVPHNLALSPNEDRLYVTHSGGMSDQVSIVDVSDPTNPAYITSVTVGFNPFGIATVIPEPATLSLLALATPLLLRRRRS